MYSRGSVIPLFVEQIAAGRRLTLTDPAMTRFLMSLDEAVELVEYAFSHARPGDLFVRKAPACTIEVLAIAIAELFGREPRFEVIGTRHGEKLYETLVSREELARSEDRGDYYLVPVDTRDLNYGLYFEGGDPAESQLADFTSHNAERLDVSGVTELLLRLPEIRVELSAHGRPVHLVGRAS
jgi:UDP-glucose 4-epimerase